MKKRFTILIAAIAAILLITQAGKAVGQVTIDTAAYKKLTFPDDNSANNQVDTYTDTWTAKMGSDSWSISYFNNHKWNDSWAYIKCGRKNNASTGTITTSFKVDKPVRSVTISIGAITTNKVTSISLYKSTDGTNWGSAVGTFTKATGLKTVVIPTPTKDLYYKIEAVCTSGTSNGLLRIDSLQYNVQTFTVTYNNNGGSGNMTDSKSPYWIGDTVTTKANAFTAPTGYTFSGWNTAANGSGQSYAEGDEFVITTNTTLYAQWQSAGPAVSTDPTSLTFGEVAVGTSPSPTRTVQITHANLSSNLTLSVPTGFGVSPESIDKNASSPTNVTVTFTPTAIQSYDGNLQISGGGLGSAINVPITASGTCGAPANPLAYPDYELTLAGSSIGCTLTPTTGTGNGGAITYAMKTNPGSAGSVVANTGVFTATGTGTYEVTATQALNGTTCGASVDITIVVNDTNPTCTIEPDMWDFGKVLTDSVVTKTFIVTTTNLTCDLDVSIENTADGFSVSPDHITSGSTSTEVTVRFAPTAATSALTPMLTISGDCLDEDTEALIGGQGDAGYIVTFNKWSGSCDTTSMRVIQGDTIAKLPTAHPSEQCTEDGWTFLGWATAKVNETSTAPTVYTSNYKVTSTHALHAVYNYGGSTTSVVELKDGTMTGTGTSAYITWSEDYITITQEKGSSSTSVGNYIDHPRWYQDHVITFDPASTINSVIIKQYDNKYGLEDSNTSITNGSASADEHVVTITPTNGSNNIVITMGAQARIDSIWVNYNLATTYNSNPICLEKVATPNITLTAGTYTSVQTTKITCETTGATIYYTTDGSTPDDNSILYVANSDIAIDTTMTIKAVAYKTDMAPSDIASKSYVINLPLTTMDAIFARATAIGTTADTVTVIFNNWVVSGVNGSTVYVTDNTGKGFMIYTSSNGFAVNDIISGTVTGTPLKLFNGSAEFTNLTSTTTGLTVTKNGTVTPVTMTIGQLTGGVNTGALITLNNVRYYNSKLQDPENSEITISLYNAFGYSPSLISDHNYNVTGVYVNYYTTKQVAPRNSNDIVEVEYDITLTQPAGGTIGTSGDIKTAKFGQKVTLEPTPADHYRLGSWTVTNDETSAPITVDANNQFTMPKASVTVTATFVQLYDIAIATGIEHGTVALTNPQATPAAEGDNIALTVTPATGYALKSLTVYKTGYETTTVDVTNNAFTMPAYPVTITAEFDAEYTVTYYRNAVNNDETAELTYGEGADVTILAYDDNDVDFEAPEGKKFVKWTTNADGTGDEYQPADVIDDIADNYDLYAQWRDIVYHVSFSVNGVVVSERNVAYNTAIGELPEDPELAPLTFLGWSSTSATGATDVTASWKPTGENENVTVYAVFGSEGNQATMTITSADMPISYPSYNSDSVMIQSKCYFGLYNVGHFSNNNKIQFKKQENSHYSYIYNAGDLGTLDSIVINYSDEQYDLTVTVGTTIRPTGGTAITARQTTGTTRSFILTGGCYTHFIIQNESTNTFKINSIALHYRPTTTVTVNVVTDNTNMSDDIETTTCVVVKDGATLNFTGDNKGNANNLIIENGGQLILPNNATVAATVQKTIEAAVDPTLKAGEEAFGWYTISSSVNNAMIAGEGANTNLITTTSAPFDFDLYRYNETANEYQWENYHANDDFTYMTNGRGYLYRNATNLTATFTGTVNTGNITYKVTKTGAVPFPGINLIGNPYTHDIYKGTGGAIDDTKLSEGFYVATNSGEWIPCTDNSTPIEKNQGILVQTTETFDLTMTNVITGGPSAKANRDNIKFMVVNSQNEDVAYAIFDKGYGLNKINHRNADAQKLYINHEGENYAIAMMDDDTKVINLNFEAKTFGKYTLSLKANGNFSYLHLIDKLTGEDVDMLLEDEYSFIASPSDNENRFIVRLNYSENSEISETFAYQSGSDIVVTGEGELQVFDVMGRTVKTQHINGVETINVPTNGVYIFRLNEKAQKIIIK